MLIVYMMVSPPSCFNLSILSIHMHALWRYTRPLWFKNARNLPNEHHCKTYRSSITSMVINRSIGEGARESDQAWISLARGSLMCPSSCYDRTWDRQRGKTIGPRVRSDAKHSVILKINRSMSGNRGLCETLCLLDQRSQVENLLITL